LREKLDQDIKLSLRHITVRKKFFVHRLLDLKPIRIAKIDG